MFVYFFLLLFLEIKTLISNMKVYLVTFGSFSIWYFWRIIWSCFSCFLHCELKKNGEQKKVHTHIHITSHKSTNPQRCKFCASQFPMPQSELHMGQQAM